MISLLALACRQEPDPGTRLHPPDPPATSLPCDGTGYLTVYPDADGDGFTGKTPLETCGPLPGASTDPGDDCDDADPLAYPGAWDAPLDGVDRNCDGADADHVACGYTSRAFDGSLEVDAPEDLEGFCFDYNGLTGDLVVTGDIADLSGLYCLCDVGGDLRVEDTTALAELDVFEASVQVSGDVRIVGNVALVGASVGMSVLGDVEVADNPLLEWGPVLSDLTGRLAVRRNPALLRAPSIATYLLTSFEFVDNDAATDLGLAYGFITTTILEDVVITDNAALSELEPFASLQSVGGSFVVERNDELDAITIGEPDPFTGFVPPFSLGGDLVLRDNPELWHLTLEVDDVGGDVLLERNDTIEVVALYDLRAVGGDLRVADNGVLFVIGASKGVDGADLVVSGDFELARNGLRVNHTRDLGFGTRLLEVGGDLVLTDTATPPDGTFVFEGLAEVGGDLVLEGPGMPGNAMPVLAAVGGSVRVIRGDVYNYGRSFPSLATIGGTIEVADNGGAPSVSFPILDQLGADLAIRGNAALVGIDVGPLAEVPGDLQVSGNGLLADVTGLHGLETVGGDLTVTDNPALAQADATALVGAIETIGGAVTVEDNGP